MVEVKSKDLSSKREVMSANQYFNAKELRFFYILDWHLNSNFTSSNIHRADADEFVDINLLMGQFCLSMFKKFICIFLIERF